MAAWTDSFSTGDQTDEARFLFYKGGFSVCVRCNSHNISMKNKISGQSDEGDEKYGMDVYSCNTCGWSASFQFNDAESERYQGKNRIEDYQGQVILSRGCSVELEEEIKNTTNTLFPNNILAEDEIDETTTKFYEHGYSACIRCNSHNISIKYEVAGEGDEECRSGMEVYLCSTCGWSASVQFGAADRAIQNRKRDIGVQEGKLILARGCSIELEEDIMKTTEKMFPVLMENQESHIAPQLAVGEVNDIATNRATDKEVVGGRATPEDNKV